METRNSQCEMIHLVNAARAESGARTNQRIRSEARGEVKDPKGMSQESDRIDGKCAERKGADETRRGEEKEGKRSEGNRSELALLGLLERLAAAVEALELIGRLLRQEFHEVIHLALALYT